MAAKVLAATRLHFPHGTDVLPEATEKHLRNYLVAAERLGTAVAIAVNSQVEAIRSIASEETPGLGVEILYVPCWGAFVPALNTLLGHAQRRGMQHILYQSLETTCTPEVLARLLDHFTRDTLVVGAALSGHTFEEGEQPLNGRTTPWNTLALWSVRKLSLTGFLAIADGLPLTDMVPEANPQDDSLGVMGSESWWNSEPDEITGFGRQETLRSAEVPAGVEEVTVIALIQHLLGHEKSRAIVVRLPEELTAGVSWAAAWQGDERRRTWHEYKMKTKITRPAAQLQFLFPTNSPGRFSSKDRVVSKDAPGSSDAEFVPEEKEDAPPARGVVLHLGPSISPPPRVEWLCLATQLLFFANFSSVLAAAFGLMNASGKPDGPSGYMGPCMAGLLVGAPYIPMPLSLSLMRAVARRFSHRSALALFASILLLTHITVAVSQTFLGVRYRAEVLLASRLVQGLGSGVVFLARYLHAAVSTSDQHETLTASGFLASDLGLGLGALLPAVVTAWGGGDELSDAAPELATSVVLVGASLALLLGVLALFPSRPHILPDRVRFGQDSPPCRVWLSHGFLSHLENSLPRARVFLSGTLRVFVQSSLLLAAALSLQDARCTGRFRQSLAVAALCLIPMPFQVFTTRCCSGCARRPARREGSGGVLACGAVGFTMLCAVAAQLDDNEVTDFSAVPMRLLELAVLKVLLAVSAPINEARLGSLGGDTERISVLLSWWQAYAGRLLGPMFAVGVSELFGWSVLARILCFLTGLVVLSA